MIVDTHTHFYDTSRPDGVPWPPEHHATLYRPVCLNISARWRSQRA